MDEQAKRKRQSYGDEFKRDAMRLVVEEGVFVQGSVRSGRGMRCDAAGVARQAGSSARAVRRRRHGRRAEGRDDSRSQAAQASRVGA